MGVVTHGKSDTPIYWIWNQMIERCTRKTHKSYHRYGARGWSVEEALTTPTGPQAKKAA